MLEAVLGRVEELNPPLNAVVTHILDHCCEAWRKLTDQPWRIISLGLREWAHEC